MRLPLAFAVILAFMVSQANAEKVTLSCKGRTIARRELGIIEWTKQWDNEVLIFDLSKRVILHGDETEGDTLTTVTDAAITWKTDEMGGLGHFSRVNLSGGEVLHGLDHIFQNYYDKCTLTTPRF